jgi:hypothetical protein
MDNFQLTEFLKKTKCQTDKIMVLACDQLPTSQLISPGSVIISNLSPITALEGTHWCLFFYPSAHHPDFRGKTERTLVWFDSLGIAHIDLYPQFRKFLKNYGPYITNNGSPVQEVKRYSETCGMYCLYVGMKLCAGEGLQTIMNTFDSKNLNWNECMVLDYLTKSFKTADFNQYEGCWK